MNENDISGGMRLKEAAGWNQTEEDWRRFLELSPDGCFVAESGGDLVGTVTTVNYENRVSWIGMILVDSNHRRRGIATALMKTAIGHLEGKGTVKLDATPDGREVYRRLGFKEEYTLYRLVADSAGGGLAGNENVMSISRKLLKELFTRDRIVFGADRSGLLMSLVQPGYFFGGQDGIAGYCFGRRGTNFMQVGPLVADNAEQAAALAAVMIANTGQKACVLDVPAGQKTFIDMLTQNEFSVQRPLYRMYLGENSYPGQVDHVYAIAGPELG